MTNPTTPMSAETRDIAARWAQAALATGPADRTEAAARAAYRAAGHPEPSRFVWCPSPSAAGGQLRRLLDDGRTSLVGSVRGGNLNRCLAAVRAPIWAQSSDADRVAAFRDAPITAVPRRSATDANRTKTHHQITASSVAAGL
ncbi:hypothetical protein [Micromonospora sp. WMMD812]|uniref:hypothetical protein n=1 Tax=Micromonospora sp. WMMD812 TaxID=3015152 RepID=UPI00248AB083|nr:hypothetical protein [Micromonospora sp. WMMD812]WBB69113.1 hypothetical protein O7603_07120 [Micromonospora sp. WMMD812]